MNHQIKLNRARKYAGTLPMATEHILRNIPKSAIDKLTGREIAELMQAMHKHYHEGVAQGTSELTDYIGLPAGVDIWAVIGDADYLGYKTFDDGLSIPEILAARGRQVAAWKAEEREKPE